MSPLNSTIDFPLRRVTSAHGISATTEVKFLARRRGIIRAASQAADFDEARQRQLDARCQPPATRERHYFDTAVTD